MIQAMFFPPKLFDSDYYYMEKKLAEKLLQASYILSSVKYLIVSMMSLWTWMRNGVCIRMLSGGVTFDQTLKSGKETSFNMETFFLMAILNVLITILNGNSWMLTELRELANTLCRFHFL